MIWRSWYGDLLLAEQFDAFFLDLDGVVYLGDRPLPGAKAALERLRGLGKTLRFLTNDPRPTRLELAQRLAAMGIEVRPEEVISAGWATACYLRQHRLDAVCVIGSAGLAAEIRRLGLEVVAGPCAAVVVGCDESLSYHHLRRAAQLIEGGARFIATNADRSFPTPDGPYPATGAIVAAVQAATGQRPVVIGKPYPFMFHAALQDLDPALRVAMIGDNPLTDILGAHQLGLTGILIAERLSSFPSAGDFRLADATIADLTALFDPRVHARSWDKPRFLWPERVGAGVAAVVLDRDRMVLLVKRADNDLWGLPSGRVEPGETVEEAVRREVAEETGLEVRVERLIGVYSDPASQVFAYPSGEVVHFITCCFQCEVTGGELQPDGVEALEAGFFRTDDLPQRLLTMHPEWLADALREEAPAFIR